MLLFIVCTSIYIIDMECSIWGCNLHHNFISGYNQEYIIEREGEYPTPYVAMQTRCMGIIKSSASCPS